MSEPGKHQMGTGSVKSLTSVVVGVVAGFLVVALAIFAGVQLFGGGHGQAGHPGSGGTSAGSGGTGPASTRPDIPVPSVPAAVLAKLPAADTDGRVPRAPLDLRTSSGGRTIRVAHEMAGFARPGADPIARIPAKQFGDTTWLPVLTTRDGWAKVRLPSRPNGATAWIPTAGLDTARTKWAVRVALGKGDLTITSGGRTRGTWTVGKGKPATPTPVGQTFVVSSFVDPEQTFSPVIYALGAHSATLDTYGGGPGTVAVHGWPTRNGRLGAVSHGCVRVPPAALAMFAKLPTGTPVDIVA